MKKILSTAFIVGIMLTLTAGCSSSKVNYENDTVENFQKGVALYKSEKYYKAIDFFTYVVFNSPGSEIADDAQLYLGDCHYGLKEYILAVDEYKRLINRWPASPLVEDARYKTAQALYKLSPNYQLYQNYTEEAIQEYQSFIEDYPDSRFRQDAENAIRSLRLKLARKIYDAGTLYMVFREWNAAIITFEEIENKYFDTEIIDLTYLKLAQCHKNLEEKDKADYYLSLIREKNLKKAQDKLLYRTLKD